MISIIDDDRIVREAVGDLVQSLGYEVATFDSAEGFLDSGRLAETSCLITDLQLPGVNGLELQTKLLADGASLPIIFITAFPQEKFRKRAMNAGAVGFLNKPFEEHVFLDCLDTALKASKGTRRKHSLAGAFDADEVRILAEAFEQAWKAVQESGAPFACEGDASATREFLAMRIIDIAQLGERDPARLRDDALRYLARANLKNSGA
jgi:FixJ family two-component response regulator